MSAKLFAVPALLLAATMLSSCGRQPSHDNQSNMTAQQADAALDDAMNGVEDADVDQPGALIPPAPGEVGGLPDDREPLNERAARIPTSVEASGATIERWGFALAEGRYGDAYRLWRDEGRQSGMTQAQFADSYRKYSEIHVLVGRPQAGGTQTARVPVQVYGRLRDGGRPFNLIGMMTLARNPNGQQGEAGQTPWLIAASELQPRGTVRIASPEGEKAARIPAAFRGTWSGTAATCGKPGDDMRLAVNVDSLVFYESEGRVTAVRPLGANRIEVTANYSGEGDEWSDKSVLALSDGGVALTIGKVKRVRCMT
ncbi:hypothetical protein [Sphingobium nicotianae]|uniref:C-type lysozyme inhibitor domain-containing protein n=1 Tax=Sphingobium nicotianae TaxID=2782607 RepID=A0A9X1DEF6_9SPHN|nr:hypothetical protein [Sphingobium nicotianae]MBT2188420.1 hypothetical protein [Sphingobium nicotianae]